MLEQTEQFKQEAPTAKVEPKVEDKTPELPETTLLPDTLPTAAMTDVPAKWNAWREAATHQNVTVADLENTYRRGTETPAKKDAAAAAQAQYVSARAVQALECRVRTSVNDRVCLDAARHTADYANAREDALRATLELERSMSADLRKNLDQLREESQTRQESLRQSLSQMEGKFASVRQERSTIEPRRTFCSINKAHCAATSSSTRQDATILNQFDEMNVLLEGHTDAIGTDEYNLTLSKKRAQAVSDFLASQGVNAKRLSWEGYGKTRPVADNDSDEGRQKNRRVDLVIQDAPTTKAAN